MSKFDPNKYKVALSPLVLKASAELELNENFKVTVLHLNTGNQVYHAATSEYMKGRKELPDDFFKRLWEQEYFPEAVDFVAHVLMLDWVLMGEDDQSEPFTSEGAVALMSDDRFGKYVYTRIVQFAINSAFFKDDWEKKITKN